MSAPVARRPAVALTTLAVACSAAFLLVVMHPLTFTLDEWDFLVDRRDWTLDSFLDPHNEHISVIPVAIYKVLVTVFGMTSQLPFQLVLTTCTLACALLVWVYVRRRLGDWLALAAILPLLFLGSGAINLIWPFQVTIMGSLAFGMGALLALDRDEPGGDRLACALLVLSVLTSSPGVAFVIAVAFAVLLGPDRWSRAYVFGVPAVIYAAWWLGWGVSPDDPVTAADVVHLPVEVFNGYASSIASLLGLTVGLDGDPMSPLTLGRPLLVIALVLAAYRLWRLGSFPRPLVTVLVLGVTFWVLLGLVGAGDPDRQPTNGRYQYLGAVFVILAAAEVYRGVRPGRVAVGAAVAVAAVATVGNLRALDTTRDFFHNLSIQTRVNLGAGEIAGAAADPHASPVPWVELGPYLDAVAAYGSPAYSEEELTRASEFERVLADQEFGKLYALTPVAAPASSSPPPTHCVGLAPGTPASAAIGPGAVRIETDGEAALALRRFADEYPLVLSNVGPKQPVVLTVPDDESSVRWTLAVTSDSPSRVCAL